MPQKRLLYKDTKKIPKTFEENEIAEIIKQVFRSEDYLKNEWGKWMRFRDAALVATIYFLALRPKEACGLRFDDFDLRKMIVKIRGENNKVKKDRVIPIPKILKYFLEPYLKFPRTRFWKGSPYLFPSFSNNRISAGRLKHIFREKLLKPLGLWEIPKNWKLPKYRLYTLRHSRASHILKKQNKKFGQTDIYAIANLLGHADLRSTLIYLHTDEDYTNYLREQVDL